MFCDFNIALIRLRFINTLLSDVGFLDVVPFNDVLFVVALLHVALFNVTSFDVAL